ncbi:MAG: hypothetical protein JWQ47_237 [Glaciihabitans sp.]|nr:hypothetical protein [Glaciihabitans sp.]
MGVREIPRRIWLGLSLILCASAVLYSWNLGSGGFSDYYATAARSMGLSWRAFAFGAFDPNATITLDKLAGFLIPQALSVRVFGFSAWALGLPQVIEGLVTIAAVFYLVARWIGPRAGLVGACAMAFTPLLVSMFAHPMEDSMLTMFTVLAVVAWQRGMELGSTRWLVIAGVMVGLGFQAKMLQSWLVLPAMVVVFLLAASGSRRHRLGQIAVFGLTTVAVSVSWMTAISLVPASSRPYIDGTSNNNIFSMVFGYNGIDHFLRGAVPGALSAAPPAGGSVRTSSMLIKLIGHTPLKLFFPEYATQIGWLFPLAAAGIVLGILELRRARGAGTPIAPLGIAVLFSTAFLLTLAVVLGLMSLPHTTYLASMALPLAVLCAVGVTLLWRAFRRREPRWKYALPITVAVQCAWVVDLLSNFPAFANWMTPPILVIGALATVLLFRSARGRTNARAMGHAINPFVAIAALGLALLGPIVWSFSTLSLPFAGSPNDAYAGPRVTSLFNPPVTSPALYGSGLSSNRARPKTATVEDAGYDYAFARARRLTYVLATDSWRSDAPLIMDDARRTLAIGGFTSKAPSLTTSRIEDLIEQGQLRYLLLTGPSAKNIGATPPDLQFRNWAMAHCTVVPEKDYAPKRLSSTSIPDVLFACSPSGL